MHRKRQLWLALFSCALSLWLNLCVFLVTLAFGHKNPEPMVMELAGQIMTPPAAIVKWIFGNGGNGGTGTAATPGFQVYGCSLVFYAVAAWCLMTAFSVAGSRGRKAA